MLLLVYLRCSNSMTDDSLSIHATAHVELTMKPLYMCREFSGMCTLSSYDDFASHQFGVSHGDTVLDILTIATCARTFLLTTSRLGINSFFAKNVPSDLFNTLWLWLCDAGPTDLVS